MKIEKKSKNCEFKGGHIKKIKINYQKNLFIGKIMEAIVNIESVNEN